MELQSTHELRHRYIEVKDARIHVVECGMLNDPVVLFLHGWPQDWSAFEKVMILAGQTVHAVSVDMPGMGASSCEPLVGSKKEIAAYVYGVVQALDLQHVTLVGHDCGGMVTYSYLTNHGDYLERAIIIDVAVPGIDPWDEVLRNPHIWHFAFHTIPELPEKLVQGKQADYFDFFFDAMSLKPELITTESRERYAKAYTQPSALSTGFEWYRAFTQDKKDNTPAPSQSIQTPVLYLRGSHSGVSIEPYIAGFTRAGLVNIEGKKIEGSGHFIADEQPEKLWECIAEFMK
ncbi:MAG: alpha/beta hydrolase [Candidatus Saccharibacteria bacterium]|nr:alpha/beta hydrolase [Candidatus Saccharibacteria bacterium]